MCVFRVARFRDDARARELFSSRARRDEVEVGLAESKSRKSSGVSAARLGFSLLRANS